MKEILIVGAIATFLFLCIVVAIRESLAHWNPSSAADPLVRSREDAAALISVIAELTVPAPAGSLIYPLYCLLLIQPTFKIRQQYESRKQKNSPRAVTERLKVETLFYSLISVHYSDLDQPHFGCQLP